MRAFEVEWTINALEAVRQHAVYLRDHTQRAPSEWIERLFERVGTCGSLPFQAPQWERAQDQTLRRLVVDQHVVIYRVIEDQERVVVLSVRHGRQRPPSHDDL